MSTKLLDNKVAIVTGGSRGLGLAIATALGIDGAKVLVVARDPDLVEQAVNAVERSGAEATGCTLSVTERGSAATVVNTALSRFGRIDILVNNAAHFVWKKFLDLEPADWDEAIATNLTAPFLLTLEAGRVMAGGSDGSAATGGAIVNVASIHGTHADPNVVPQCATKAGLIALTRASADALREHNVRVNAIAPGVIQPNTTSERGRSPMHKVTQADIATMVVYLASDLARTITGAVIDMYGSTRTTIKI